MPGVCTGTERSNRSAMVRQLGLSSVTTRKEKVYVAASLLTKRSTRSATMSCILGVW